MKSARDIFFFIATAMIPYSGCKKPYVPSVVAASNNYLVVEGVIDPGQDSTIIKLSRTIPLSSIAESKPELNAKVVVENDANTSYTLSEVGNGCYASPGLNLSTSNKYHLRITTADNKAYQSDFISIKNSPPIDSINYLIKGNDLQINVNTHDPSKSTSYYRWEFNETWIIRSAFSSTSVLVTSPQDTIGYRTPENQIYMCWQSARSSTIILGSSAKLSSDVIANNPLTDLASTSEKIANRYSILVKQFALTGDAFNYWQQLKKNTEQLGGVFDPQPSEIIGNIHCVTDPSEKVIGYISVGSVSQKRIFIDNHELPAWRATSPNDNCKLDTFLFVRYLPKSKTPINEVKLYLYTGEMFPVGAIQPAGAPGPIGYTASSRECADCTLRGTTKRPAFWINE